MAVDMFLKLEDPVIKGESKDHKHPDQIEVLSYSFGVSQTGTGAYGGGHGAGKANFTDFQFTHRQDKASPTLFLMAANGKHIKKGQLVVRKAGGDQQEYLIIKFTDILVSHVQNGGSGGDEIPHEQVSLNFAKIEIDYKAQKEDGTLDAGIKAGWDLKKNVAV